MSISVVAPVFNELENLEPLVHRVCRAMEKNHITQWELILVDDGSRDGSTERINDIATRQRRVRPLHFDRNYGQTAAMDAGMRHARFPLVLTMDADLQNDPADLPRLLESMAPGVGCVCGVRLNRNDSAVRRLSSRIANWVRNRLSDENITDTGCSLKLFRKECIDRLKLYEGMHRFLPTLVKMEGYEVVEVPVNHLPRLKGVSKYGIRNRLLRSFLDLLAVRWMKKRRLNYRVVRNGAGKVHSAEAFRAEASQAAESPNRLVANHAS